MWRPSGGGVAYTVDPIGVRQASDHVRDRVTEKAGYRAEIPWPVVSDLGSDSVADMVEGLNRSYRASWANLRDRLCALAETSRQAAQLYEDTDRQVVTDANAPAASFAVS